MKAAQRGWTIEETSSKLTEVSARAQERARLMMRVTRPSPRKTQQWGMLNGKLSALRLVLGDEWDMLDT